MPTILMLMFIHVYLMAHSNTGYIKLQNQDKKTNVFNPRSNRCTPVQDYVYNYSRTSMARTALGPWILVRDRGSSSQ